MTPKVKTPVEAIMPHRRPKRSPIGDAPSAPKKVPADRSDTIVDFCVDVMFGKPSFGSIYPVENSFRQYGIAKIPPIVPVSYLKLFNQSEERSSWREYLG